ncbi:MAG: bifunctional folylpolyglutamate synthase/dihydrofolate synthase [Proteobacteria bacterium]|nr:bifunctional folylpolyglutamate synthase/dihydrofolate synthase [Pseudomonadota bacterium]
MSSKSFDKGSGDSKSSALLERLKTLHPLTIDLSLDRITRLLTKLGNPEQKLPPVIHVAGTNGKGSVVAFSRAIAEAFGRRVHVYTSPHLVSFNERIVIGQFGGGASISEPLLIECLSEVERQNAGDPITLFEITTAAAFLAFASIPADLVLLETGLGGRLDATNVVSTPAATVITPISYDHMEFLGSSLSAIAREKAGILKRGVPCIVGPQSNEAFQVIKRRAEDLNVCLKVFRKDFSAAKRDGSWLLDVGGQQANLPLPALKGPHQIENAATAIAAMKTVYGSKLSKAAIWRAMLSARWPARLECLPLGGLHTFVNEGTEIWLDGGHNVAGANAIACAIEEFGWRNDGPVHLIWGMMETKDADNAIRAFRNCVDHIFTVKIPDEVGSFDAVKLASFARRHRLAATPANGIRQALLMSQAQSHPSPRILICGSLYLAGHALKLHGNGIRTGETSTVTAALVKAVGAV